MKPPLNQEKTMEHQKAKLSDDRGSGMQTPVEDNPPYEMQENFEVPEKDSGRQLTKMKRLHGSTPAKSQKVRTAPSQK